MKRVKTTTTSSARKLHSRKYASLESRRVIVSILLLLPALASLVFFKYLPFFMGAFISFFKFDLVNMPGKFIGLQNYINVFKDVRFYTALWHNLKAWCYSLVMSFWIPIVLAILINEIKKGRTVFRLVYFIPGCAPGIAMQILWKFFWQPDYGLANYLVGLLGIEPQLWLNDVNLVYFCMAFPGMVVCGGMSLIIYLASLQNIPQELYEASVIDGASVVQRFKNITLPQISGTIFLMLSLSFIGALNAMEGVLVLTGGGPSGSTETALLYAYKKATEGMDYSYAMAMITVVFVVVLVLNILANKLKKED